MIKKNEETYENVATDGVDKNITPEVYYCKSQTVLSLAGKGYMEYSSYSNRLVTENIWRASKYS